jgi:excisionase family DNA binding protein
VGDVPLPSPAIPLVVELLERIASGEPTAMFGARQDLTTQQVADLLGVSRPFVVQLIDAGQLPAHRVGTHRRIRSADALRYRDQQRRRANRALGELAELDRSMGFL